MESEGNTSEAETQVQDSTEGVEAPANAAVASEAPKQRFFDKFGKGSIAAMAAVAGLVVGVGGSAALGDDHDGRGHHRGDRFGMERDGGWGGPDGSRGQGGPPPMMYGGQGGPQGGAAPGAQPQQAPQTQQAPQAQQGNRKNGSYVAPSAVGTSQSY